MLPLSLFPQRFILDVMEPFITIDDLMAALPVRFTPPERELVLRAYRLAEQAHDGQMRATGQPYITHCLFVARILADYRVPPAVIAAGLLHDTVEDTDVTLEDLEREFGEEVARLVSGVTKLIHLPRVSRGDTQGELTVAEQAALVETERRTRRYHLSAETWRNTFLAMAEDPRVVLIKLADRLHNMRTLYALPEEKRRRIARETLDLFAPLANRLGIWQMKWELEDLAFRYLEPETYKEIATRLNERREQREREVQQIVERLRRLLVEEGIQAEVTGRPKHIYSIYRKMQRKGVPFEKVYDVRGVRIIVNEVKECYLVLGLIHTHWRPIPSEFDDYIASPKDNFYRSLHTAVKWEDGKTLEVQIRTREMHEQAEYGIAAHWRYKEGAPHDEAYEQRVRMLRQMMEWRNEVEDADEFVDGMQSDVFSDRVFVFTPRGDIIDLPAGSTPIDFAYHIHTEVGHRCRGARVNGRLVSLDYVLKTGDEVEILTAKRGGPSRDWLNPHLHMVATTRARAKIRQWFKRQNREHNLSRGRTILEREFKRLAVGEVNLERLANDLGYKSTEDMLVALGCGDLPLSKLVNRLPLPEREDTQQRRPVRRDDGTQPDILGLQGMLYRLAGCCKPAQGDEIIGYVTRGYGVTVHRRDCPNVLNNTERERLVSLQWGTQKATYPVAVEVVAFDRDGLMRDISTVIANEGVNISNVQVKVTGHRALIELVLQVASVAELSKLLTLLEQIPNVLEARRRRPG